jgi:uncharacterized protein YgbK (DUF1537 family)
MALLGCIADDFTGATDLAGMLVKSGMRTVQMIGIPTEPLADDVDAIVIALKTRTIPANDAIRQSLEALKWLQSMGCRQFYFKYCSTFDSTPAGNIGPVGDALLEALESDFTIACPAFPANKRTIYKGMLFVGDVPLHESSMKDHPLTPMRDSNLVRVLGAQTAGRVGLADHGSISAGSAHLRARFAALKKEGARYAIVDAIDEADLRVIGEACSDMPLVTAGSGLAIGIADNFRRDGHLKALSSAAELPAITGARAVVSGSCSAASLRQVAAMRASHPSFRIDPLSLASGDNQVKDALTWAEPKLADGPVLIYATATPDEVKAAQAVLGVDRAGSIVEDALASIAAGLVRLGVRQLLVAGGETAGAVVNALGVTGLQIGPEIDPGVPWTASLPAGDSPAIAMALKSGNFGTDDFFLKAWTYWRIEV